jgi:predicted lipoprotein
MRTPFTRITLTTLLALPLFGLPPALAQESPVTPGVLDTAKVPGVMARAVDSFIRPGYHHFTEEADTMEESMALLCRTPSAETQLNAQSTFGDLVEAWSRIEIVRVGPVLDGNRFERILFFPDRKGTGLKQVQAALAKPDPSVTSVDTLKDKSVAMQGLGALEFVLFGTGSETLGTAEGSYRCQYGTAIAANLKRLGTELTQAWDAPDGVASAWKTPGPNNPIYRDEAEAAKELLGVLVHAAETIRDQRIEHFYKGDVAKALPRQAIYWRSGNTFRSITANIEGLRDLLDTSGMIDLLAEDNRSVVSSTDFVARSLSRVSADVEPDVAKALETPEQVAKLDFLLLNSRDLILRLNNDLGGGIGLAAGFSFSDGD